MGKKTNEAKVQAQRQAQEAKKKQRRRPAIDVKAEEGQPVEVPARTPKQPYKRLSPGSRHH